MKNELKSQIQADIFRYFNTKKRPLLYKLRMPSVKYTIALRKAKYFKQHNKIIRYTFNEMLLKVYTAKYFIQIPSETCIGRGLYIGHLGSLIINPKVKIGDNVNLATGVTIGQTNRGKNKGCPTIGNKVWIGTNAVIVGKINIGNNVLIAPNSSVNIDVPNNSIVIGNPARIIPNKNATDDYVHNLI